MKYINSLRYNDYAILTKGKHMAILNPPEPKHIKDLRSSVKISQQQSANLLHTTIRTWQRWEYGTTPMPLMAWELYAIKCEMIRNGTIPL